MRRVLKVLILTAALAVTLAPALAHAEGYVSPWVAANAGTRFGDFDNGRAGFGVDAGGMGKGIIGGELDFGFGAVLRGEKYQRVFALRVLRAARFGQTEACAEKAQACVEVAHADHGVQVAHNEYQALDE